MDDIVAQVSKYVEAPIDFTGQKVVDYFHQVFIVTSGVLAFVTGYLMQSVFWAAALFGIGLLITLISFVPPWSCFKQNQVKWLPSDSNDETLTKKKD